MSQRYRSQKRSSASDYVVPFFIIVSVGVILVLLFNLWHAIFKGNSADGAYIHVIEGTVEMRTWNTEDFFNVTDDVLMLPGDELKTSSDASVIVEFFDGTVMRVGGGGNLVLNEITNTEKEKAIHILLVNGKIWFNKVYKDTGSTYVEIKTDSIAVKSDSLGIFEVENEFHDIARVMFGPDVNVDIFAEDGKKVVETEKVGVGQEIVFSSDVLARYWSYQSPSVLSAISDEFKTSKWYLWNNTEDKHPTEFVKIEGVEGGFKRVEPEVMTQEAPVLDLVDGEALPEDATLTKDAPADEVKKEEEVKATVQAEKGADLGKLTIPKIISVSGKTNVNENGFYVETSRLATLKGSVSGAEKVVVNGFTLTKFKPGDKEWTYFANADFALMREGENTYEVYAVAPDGSKSEKLVVKVFHDPKVAEPAPVADTSEVVAQ